MQLAEFQQKIDDLKAANISVFGVNPGGTQDHEAFATKCGFAFPLLVDTDGLVALDYSSAIRLPIGVRVVRTVVLVDPSHRIQMVERGMPPVDTILRIASVA